MAKRIESAQRSKLEVAISAKSKDSDHNLTTPPDNYTTFTMSEVRVKVEPKDFPLSPFPLALIGMVGLPAILYIGRQMDKRRQELSAHGHLRHTDRCIVLYRRRLR